MMDINVLRKKALDEYHQLRAKANAAAERVRLLDKFIKLQSEVGDVMVRRVKKQVEKKERTLSDESREKMRVAAIERWRVRKLQMARKSKSRSS